MENSYEESLASCFGLSQRGGEGNDTVLSVCPEEHAGQPLSSEITISVCRSRPVTEKATSSFAFWRAFDGHGGVVDPVHVWKLQTRESGDPISTSVHLLRQDCQRVLERNGQQTFQTVPLT